MQNKAQFITDTRGIAAQLITTINQIYALSERFAYGGATDDPADGGLSDGNPDDPADLGDFIGVNEGLTRSDIIAFYTTMETLLKPLTAEQKTAIYKVAF